MVDLMTMCKCKLFLAHEVWDDDSDVSYRSAFERGKPDLFAPGHLVEVQVAFHAVRVSRGEYVFLPKLRALCLLDRTAERVSVFSNDRNAMDQLTSTLRSTTPLRYER